MTKPKTTKRPAAKRPATKATTKPAAAPKVAADPQPTPPAHGHDGISYHPANDVDR